MAVKKIHPPRYECTCDLPDCCGKGEPWITRADSLPARCRWCKRHTWNGVDRRHRNFTPEEGAINAANARARWDKKDEVA